MTEETLQTILGDALEGKFDKADEASESTLNDVLCDLREKVAKIIWLEIKEVECSNEISYKKADEIIKLCVEKLST